MAAKRKESKRSQRYPHSIWIAWTPVNQRWFLLQGKGPSDSIILDRFDTRAEAASAAERLTSGVTKRDPSRSRQSVKAKHGMQAADFVRRGNEAEKAGEDSSAAFWYLKASEHYEKAGNKLRAMLWWRRGKDLQRPESKREMGTLYRGPYPKKPGPKRSTYGKSVYSFKRPKRRDPNREEDMSSEATELLLYLDNDEPLYRRKKEFLKNVYTKMKRGTYSPALARKLWMYYVEEAAKKYEKEYLNPGEWHKVFPPAVRREVAKELEERERRMIESGEYKDFPPVRVLHDPASRRTGPASRRKGSGSRRKSR